jgi:glutamate synthase (NADPH/NADH) large chain
VPNDQKEILLGIITSFFNETESQVAGNLLLDWENSLARVSLVMPRDYARVLAAMEKATREGLPIDQYVMEVAANG